MPKTHGASLSVSLDAFHRRRSSAAAPGMRSSLQQHQAAAPSYAQIRFLSKCERRSCHAAAREQPLRERRAPRGSSVGVSSSNTAQPHNVGLGNVCLPICIAASIPRTCSQIGCVVTLPAMQSPHTAVLLVWRDDAILTEVATQSRTTATSRKCSRGLAECDILHYIYDRRIIQPVHGVTLHNQ